MSTLQYEPSSAVAVERHPDGSSKGLAYVRMRDGAVATEFQFKTF